MPPRGTTLGEELVSHGVGSGAASIAAPSPPRAERDAHPTLTSTKRRQTLRTLLDALHELQRDDSEGPGKVTSQGKFEDDRDVPTTDEHIQKVGAEAFDRFQRRVIKLDTELRNFSNAARQLGSSVRILSSAFKLRERLAHLLHLFHENAADLFPRRISHQKAETMLHPIARPDHRKVHKTRKAPPPGVAQPSANHDLDPEDFPNQFGLLAIDVVTLLDCLNEFPEFTDEAVNASIQSFEADLKYWADCLQTYKGQFRFPAVQRYIHDLAGEMGEQLDSMTTSLAYFTEVGVPTIRLNQKHGAANLQNLSTVATFFSAVTATTMQFSYDQVNTRTQNAVNSFWFASLVFSIASAVNSLLGLTWKQAMYRSPGHRVPWWVLIWIKRSPLVFLVISVASFSIGLVLFAYASGQGEATKWITSVFTAFSSFGLVAVSAWFASERWAYAKHKGQKWLADVLEEANDRFRCLPPVRWAEGVGADFARHGKKGIKRSNTALSVASGRAKTLALQIFVPRTSTSSDDTLPTTQPPNSGMFSPGPASPALSSRMSEQAGSVIGHSSAFAHLRQMSQSAESEGSVPPPTPADGAGPSANGDGMLASPAKTRFASLVRAAVLMRRQAQGPAAAFMLAGQRQRARTATMMMPNAATTSGGMKGSRLAKMTPKLQSMQPTQDLAAHSALVRHIQFSPDGKYLATSSWDRTSQIYRVGEPFKQYRVLAHPQGFVGQVAWSPDGKLLMTKLNRGMKIWTQDGVCRKTIDRRRNVGSVTWLQGGEAFLSVEGTDVVKLDLNGTILAEYPFKHLQVHDVTPAEDNIRLLAVGTLLKSESGHEPSKCRAEKRIVVYNMDEQVIENQVPVLNEVRDITMAKNGKGALVSYENKAPPQLWKLDMVKDKENPNDKDARLVLRHTYMPKQPVDFAGPSYFGGADDSLVLCAGKAGDIHIWDRESAVLLHHVKTMTSGGDLTCIAWNHAAEDPSFMFATGSHDGAIRIWSTPPPSSLRNSQSFIIDVRAPSPGGAPSFIEGEGHSPAPSLSPNTSGRTTPNRPGVFAAEIRVESPKSDAFGFTPTDTAPPPDAVRIVGSRSRPGSPEWNYARELEQQLGGGGEPSGGRRVNFEQQLRPPQSRAGSPELRHSNGSLDGPGRYINLNAPPP